MFLITRKDEFPRAPFGGRDYEAFLCKKHGVQFWSTKQDFALQFEAEYLAQEVVEGLKTQISYGGGRCITTYAVVPLKPPVPVPVRTRGDVVECK